jgi:hypothetical protein
MAAAAHNPAFAKKVGVPGKVAKEFNQADKGTGILHSTKGHVGKSHSKTSKTHPGFKQHKKYPNT